MYNYIFKNVHALVLTYFTKMFEVRNFGPLLVKINGQELKKFVYLRVNNLNGFFKVIEVETDEILCVRYRFINFSK